MKAYFIIQNNITMKTKKLLKIIFFISVFIFVFKSNLYSQIKVKSIELNGEITNICIDSVLTVTPHILFSNVIKKIGPLKIKDDLFIDHSGLFIKAYLLYGNKLLNTEVIRSCTSFKSVENPISKMQDKVFRNIKDYLLLKPKTLYIFTVYINLEKKHPYNTYIPVNIKDTIFLSKEKNRWGLHEVITIQYEADFMPPNK